MKWLLIIYETIVLVLCLFYLYNALRIPFGTPANTGPGFYPTILGIVATPVAAVLLAGSILKARRSGQGAASTAPTAKAVSPTLVLYVVAIVAFLAVFDALGALLGSFLLVTALSKIVGMTGWMKPVVLGLGTTFCLHLVFNVVFRIGLPAGVLRGIVY